MLSAAQGVDKMARVQLLRYQNRSAAIVGLRLQAEDGAPASSYVTNVTEETHKAYLARWKEEIVRAVRNRRSRKPSFMQRRSWHTKRRALRKELNPKDVIFSPLSAHSYEQTSAHAPLRAPRWRGDSRSKVDDALRVGQPSFQADWPSHRRALHQHRTRAGLAHATVASDAVPRLRGHPG